MEQLNIFELDFTEQLLVPKGMLINIEDVFKIQSGTLVFIGEHYSLVYEVLEDDGHRAKIKYVRGYKGNMDEEMTIPSLEITGIAEPELIPLPIIKRTADLDLKVYKNMQTRFVESLTGMEKMDLITYMTVLSPFVCSPDVFMQKLKENRVKDAKRQIFYGSNYIRSIGINSLYKFVCYHNGKVKVICEKDYDNALNYTSDEIMEHYFDMQKRIVEKDVALLNPFELMMLYRQKGYFLSYRIETDEWFIQHPYSKQIVPIVNGRDSLNDVMETIQKYENRVCKPSNAVFYNTELDLFGSEKKGQQEPEELTGFIIPNGTIVSLKNYVMKYIVINDDGEKAVLKKFVKDMGDTSNEIDFEEFEIDSKEIRWFHPENLNKSVNLPYFNRPKSLLLETLLERRLNYFDTLTDKEIIDFSVTMITKNGYATTMHRFLRAMIEGDEEEAKKVIKECTSGVYSSSVAYNSLGRDREINFGPEKTREVKLSINEVISHYKKMVSNIQLTPTSKLSLGELIIAYRLKGYNLRYDHITDEYSLFKFFSNQNINITEGRTKLNKIDETIKDCESELNKNNERTFTIKSISPAR
ncbi:hypothetical protein [Viridibacillus arvi]|uniref:hypothetical protein n=1 Tax=Viridibacillus arvi TaxID=263475 RepID=UPI0034CF3179